MLRTMLSPTISYRWAIVGWLILVFGWRGLAWSQVLAFSLFLYFFGWRGGLVELAYMLSAGAAFLSARKIAQSEPWLSRERSTLAFLFGAILTPAIPALFNVTLLHFLGIVPASTPPTIMSWLREGAGILAITPVMLVHLSDSVLRWTGQPSTDLRRRPVTLAEATELAIEALWWTAALWASIQFRARYNLNVTYLAFLPPLALTLRHGMRLSTIALAVNSVLATSLWSALDWGQTYRSGIFAS
jgi:hypothetical protein